MVGSGARAESQPGANARRSEWRLSAREGSLRKAMDANSESTPHTTYRADLALLPQGWVEGALLAVGEDGRFVAPHTEDSHALRIRGVVLPGVPNLHSHTFQRALAGRAEKAATAGDDFWGWRSTMYRFLERLDPDDVEAIASELFLEMLEAGYTSVAEFHYLHRTPEGVRYADPLEMSRRLVRAATSTGIRLTLLPTVYMRAGFDDGPLEGGQRRFHFGPEEVGPALTSLALESSPLVATGLAVHSLRAVGIPQIRAALAAAEQARAPMHGRRQPVHIHVAEQTGEVEAALRHVGRRPIDFLLDELPVDDSWSLVHATHTSPRELKRLAGSGATVVLCPTTEANLGDGFFQLPDYVRAGGRWGIGSDSHVSVSPTAELRLLEYGQRLRFRIRNVVSEAGGETRSSGKALLGGAWSTGSSALGQEVGSLEVGCWADLVVLDPEHPALVGLHRDDLLDAWVFSGERSPVSSVMVGGAWTIRDGVHVRHHEIRERYRRTVERLG